MITKTKYQIWDAGKLVPAFTRKPKNPRAEKLGARNLQERELGIKYYIPASMMRRKRRSTN